MCCLGLMKMQTAERLGESYIYCKVADDKLPGQKEEREGRREERREGEREEIVREGGREGESEGENLCGIAYTLETNLFPDTEVGSGHISLGLL